jgi:hypothetical protein
MHYDRLQAHGFVGAVASSFAVNGNACSVSECERTATAVGMCDYHYRQLHRRGGILSAHPIRQKRNGVHSKGYRYVTRGGKQVLEQRVVMERKIGRPLRDNENVHHLDGDRLNNDPSNLELWVKTQPSGQRVEDKIEAAIRLLKEYPEIVGRKGLRLIPLESQEATDMLSSDFYLFVGADAPTVI